MGHGLQIKANETEEYTTLFSTIHSSRSSKKDAILRKIEDLARNRFFVQLNFFEYKIFRKLAEIGLFLMLIR